MSDLIALEQLTKHYPGQEKPAVDAIDLAIPEGEIVILVGPSGCGKTTTLKMINRIIEPSSGVIRLQGEDVTRADPDDLRRRIGYVIQQVGLFPHHTIGRNIAAVPRLMGWSRQRIDDRLDELLLSWVWTRRYIAIDTRRSSPAGSGSASAWLAPSPPTLR